MRRVARLARGETEANRTAQTAEGYLIFDCSACEVGVRGALGLALALSLPSTLPLRDEIVIVTFAVVGFSIVMQGLTTPLLLRRAGIPLTICERGPTESVRPGVAT